MVGEKRGDLKFTETKRRAAAPMNAGDPHFLCSDCSVPVYLVSRPEDKMLRLSFPKNRSIFGMVDAGPSPA
jgi:hypothetical protein